MADQVDELRKSIDELTAAIKSGRAVPSSAFSATAPAPASNSGGASQAVSAAEAAAIQQKYGISPQTLQAKGVAVGGPPAPPSPGQPSPNASGQPKQVAAGFDALYSKMKAFGLAMVSVGSVLKGLQDTREGYQLNYSLNHFFYELADMLREPIRFITNEFEGLARVMHAFNQEASSDPRPWINPGGSAYTPGKPAGFNGPGLFGPGEVFGPEGTKDAKDPGIAVKNRLRKESGLPPLPDPNNHIQPIMHTSFGDVAGLQNRLQALSTENPAQEKGLSLIEQIAKAVMVIAYGQDKADKMIPDPMIKKD